MALKNKPFRHSQILQNGLGLKIVGFAVISRLFFNARSSPGKGKGTFQRENFFVFLITESSEILLTY
jgi:hypothetical protein